MQIHIHSRENCEESLSFYALSVGFLYVLYEKQRDNWCTLQNHQHSLQRFKKAITFLWVSKKKYLIVKGKEVFHCSWKAQNPKRILQPAQFCLYYWNRTCYPSSLPRLWHKCLLTGIQAWSSEVHRLLSLTITRAPWSYCALIKMEFCIWIHAQFAHQGTITTLLEQRAPPKHRIETQLFNAKRGLMPTTLRGKDFCAPNVLSL